MRFTGEQVQVPFRRKRPRECTENESDCEEAPLPHFDLPRLKYIISKGVTVSRGKEQLERSR